MQREFNSIQLKVHVPFKGGGGDFRIEINYWISKIFSLKPFDQETFANFQGAS